MKLTFHHNLGSENTDLLAYSLYTTLSATNTVTTVSASELTLAASTSKPVKLSALGTFELTESKKPYIKSGTDKGGNRKIRENTINLYIKYRKITDFLIFPHMGAGRL